MTGIGDNKRAWLGGGAVVAVLIVLAGWFLVIDPELSAASANREQTASSNQQNQVLQIRNDDLQEKNNDQGALQAGLSAALDQLPSDGALPAFTRQLSAQANAAGVVLTGVIIGAATPVVATGGQTAAASGLGATAATTSAAAPGTTVAAAAAAPATSAGLVQMTIALNATGLGRDDLAFLRAIQWNGPRRALVTAVQLVPTAPTGATGGGPTTSSPTTSSPTTARPTTSSPTTARPTTGSKKAGSATVGSKASSSPTTSSPTTASTVVDSTMAGIDGPCTLTVTLTIFSAPLSPSAQADLDKLLSGK